MTPLKVTVVGQSCMSHYPERCILRVIVFSDGPEQESVSRDVTVTSNQLHQLFKELSPQTAEGLATPEAPVTKFSTTYLRSWSDVPLDEKGRPLPQPRVHYGTSTFLVVFRDFAKLSEVVGKLVTYPKVEIDSITWRLTEETEKKLASECRKQALRDALKKADDFAEVVGRKVVPVEIEDDGQGQDGKRFHTDKIASSAPVDTSSALGDAAMDLTPQDIEFLSQVVVKFEAETEKEN
ncbi:hypothetical protein N7462_005891 [Penicillium macrosclerotiorum]|uniref:uncharacterized protein n=1 Tax=Penicillium macrosclerotiorum TaxID=303699 RepID=UPI002547135C|nr:uncharacterized protein N7462_005891 [Penicillium macrosclerotiorum]KAJ5682726.1 hypothetical protein N7462_005891 [Penicillium macrosclerotiorum]